MRKINRFLLLPQLQVHHVRPIAVAGGGARGIVRCRGRVSLRSGGRATVLGEDGTLTVPGTTKWRRSQDVTHEETAYSFGIKEESVRRCLRRERIGLREGRGRRDPHIRGQLRILCLSVLGRRPGCCSRSDLPKASPSVSLRISFKNSERTVGKRTGPLRTSPWRMSP